MKTLETINPATEEKIFSTVAPTPKMVNEKIEQSAHAQKIWAKKSLSERISALQKVALILRTQKERNALLITESMGKPITQSKQEIEKCARLIDYYAEKAPQFLQEKRIETGAIVAKQSHEPRGLILGIMPWNFPFWQVFRFVVPNLIAGNGTLLKHAANVLGVAQKMEEIFSQAPLPPHLFSALLIGSDQVEAVIEHPLVRGVTLTGSEKAGGLVAAAAGKVIKPTLLELGGNDAYIVLEDANIEEAIEHIVRGRLSNAGQVCIAPKRIILLESIADVFTKKLKNCLERYDQGSDPKDPSTKLGPMVREKDRAYLHNQVMATLSAGAKALLGAKIPSGRGFYYPPTLLVDIPLDTPAAQEELFGPVFSLFTAKNQEEAIQLANHSCYGLAGGVFSKDCARAQSVAKKLEVGSASINACVQSWPALPFGGWKNSGYGVELGKEGLLAFTQIKIISSPKESMD